MVRYKLDVSMGSMRTEDRWDLQSQLDDFDDTEDCGSNRVERDERFDKDDRRVIEGEAEPDVIETITDELATAYPKAVFLLEVA